MTRDEAIEKAVKDMCGWCAGWARIAYSGEVGNCLDPLSPGFLPLACEHIKADREPGG